MLPPQTQSGKAVLEGLTALSKELKFYSEGFKATRKLKSTIAEIDQIKRGISTATQSTKQLEKQFRSADKEIKKGKELWDKLLSKIKGKDQAAKAAKAGSGMASIFVIAGLVVVMATKIITDIQIQNIGIENEIRQESEFQKAFQRYQRNVLDIRATNKKVDEINKKIQINTKDIDNMSKTFFEFKRLAQEARKIGNNALYEVRQGRKILEGRIEEISKKYSNSIQSIKSGYEVAIKSLRESLNQSIKSNQDRLDSVIKAAQNPETKNEIKKIQQQISTIQSGNIPGLEDKLSKIQQRIDKEGTITRELRDEIYKQIAEARKNANAASLALLNTFQAELDNRLSKLYLENDKLKADIAKQLTKGVPDEKLRELERNYASTQRALSEAVTAALSTQQQVKQTQQEVANLNNKVTEIPRQIHQANKKQDDEFFVIVGTINDRIKYIDKARKSDTDYIVTYINDQIIKVEKNVNGVLVKVPPEVIKQIEPRLQRDVSEAVAPIEGAVKKNTQDIEQLKNNPAPELDKRIGTVEKKIPQIEKDINKQKEMDKEANDKLDKLIPKIDSILPTIAGIPLIAGRVYDKLKPDIPTIPQIENATGTAMCRNLKNGCGKQAIGDAVGDILSNSNNNSKALLDKLNAGLNTADLASNLAMLDKIDKKLGDQLPGGLSRVVNQITTNQAITQIANLVTMAAAIHNCIQLSDNVSQTFFSILDNIFAIPSLIVNPEADTIDTQEVFNGAIENVMKSVFGVQEWAEIKAKWQSYNRIYQAATNSLNEIRSIGSSLNDAISTTATLTGRGFNALQNEGLIGEDNWNPTPETLRLKGGIFGKMGKLADGITIVGETLEAIESITSEIRSAVDSANEIKSNTAEMEAEIKKLLGEETKKRDEEIEALPAKEFSWEDLV